jgi:hypothetical protein
LVLLLGCGGGDDPANPGSAGSSGVGGAGTSGSGTGGTGGSAAGAGAGGTAGSSAVAGNGGTGGSSGGGGSLGTPFVPTRIASNAGGNCVITKDQLLYCWGSNVPAEDVIKYVQVSAQFERVCAILAGDEVPTGNVWCFNSTLNANTPPGKFEEVRVSEHGACARNAQNVLSCWTDGDADAAALISGAPTAPVKSFYLMQDTACAVMQTGTVQCWGREQPMSPRLTPARTDYVTVGGYRQLFGIAPDGSISGWGLGDVMPRAPGGNDFVQLAAGADHLAALRSNGQVASVGDDAADAPEGAELVELSAGDGQTCGITKAGSVICWGDGTGPQFKPPPQAVQIF